MASEKTQRNNRETLQGFAQANEYQKSIAAWRDGEHRAVGWLTRILKRIRQKKQAQSAELELLGINLNTRPGWIHASTKAKRPLRVLAGFTSSVQRPRGSNV